MDDFTQTLQKNNQKLSKLDEQLKILEELVKDYENKRVALDNSFKIYVHTSPFDKYIESIDFDYDFRAYPEISYAKINNSDLIYIDKNKYVPKIKTLETELESIFVIFANGQVITKTFN